MRMRTNFAAIALTTCSALAAHADTGYDALSDWTLLPYAKTGITAGVISSYDRNQDTLGVDALPDTNNDFGQYAGSDLNNPGWSICGSLNGPGVITRFWMPHNSADSNFGIRLYADGNLVLDTTSTALLSGQGGAASTGNVSTNPSLFTSPLVKTLLGGQVSYEPIGFNSSLVVEMNAGGNPYNWYQFSYHKLPAGSTVPTYNGALNPAQTAARQAAVNVLTHAGANPAGANANAQTLTASSPNLGAGSTLPLGKLKQRRHHPRLQHFHRQRRCCPHGRAA